MDKLKKPYQKPTVVQLSLVPEEAILEVCVNHLINTEAPDRDYCSWPWQAGGGNCRGVTRS